MESLSCFTNQPSTQTIFIHFTCVGPNHSWTTSNNHNQSQSNQIIVPMSSSSLVNTPKKIFDKIIRAIIPFIICFKNKKQEELSTNSKNIIKKIYKAIHYKILKMKKEEENQENNQEDEDKCLWKKTVLMGEKCQHLEFPGAIFYDSEGNQFSEPPRTPRNSPLMSLDQP